MRNENMNPFAMLENALDMAINMGAFLAAYMLMLAMGMPATVTLDSSSTLSLLFVAVIISSFIYQLFNLYRPIPYIRVRFTYSPIFFANLTFYGVAALSTLMFFGGARLKFNILWCLITAVISTAALILKKRTVIFFVRLSRKQRDIVKKVIIVGDNSESARSFVKEVIKDDHNGIMVLGGVGRKMGHDAGCEKLGNFEDLEDILKKYKPDYAVFAVDSYDKQHLIELVNLCDDQCVKVFFLPVIYGFFKTSKQLELVGDIPLINIHSTPLDNRFNAFLKRTIDVVGSLLLILLTSPIMLAAIIGVKISSPGPILFKQVRVGKMGKKFLMWKFRSMKVNAESKTAWSTGNDPRKTRFGTFIRKTAIDELPQLFNVLKGDMSLVGPRPEIPHYVEYFRSRIPLYMVKHYVKPGITGLAQVNGLRGDTSIDDRIHADINYLENWSLLLDLKILLKTPFKAFNKNEKFTPSKGTGGSEEATVKMLDVTNDETASGVSIQKNQTEHSEAPIKESENKAVSNTASEDVIDEKAEKEFDDGESASEAATACSNGKVEEK